MDQLVVVGEWMVVGGVVGGWIGERLGREMERWWSRQVEQPPPR